MGEGEETKQETEGGAGSWTPGALSSIILSTEQMESQECSKINSTQEKGFQGLFFRLHTTLASFKESLLKFIRVAAFFLCVLPTYIQYIPLLSPPTLFFPPLHPSFPVCTLKLLALYLSFPISPFLPCFSFSLSCLNLETGCLSVYIQTL